MISFVKIRVSSNVIATLVQEIKRSTNTKVTSGDKIQIYKSSVPLLDINITKNSITIINLSVINFRWPIVPLFFMYFVLEIPFLISLKLLQSYPFCQSVESTQFLHHYHPLHLRYHHHRHRRNDVD